MSSEKTTKKPKKAGATRRRATASKTSRAAADNGDTPLPPTYIAGETAEEREKRLAAKKALTLKAFQMTYEAHHPRRKAS